MIKRNPNYKGKRPHNLDADQLQRSATRSAATYLRRSRVRPTSRRRHPVGVLRRGRSEVRRQQGPVLGQAAARHSYLAFNHDRPLFKGANGTELAKAINYAIDRKRCSLQGGYLAGKRTDQILPPGIAGFRDADLYPLKEPDFAIAKKWARSGVKDGTASSSTPRTGRRAAVAQMFSST